MTRTLTAALAQWGGAALLLVAVIWTGVLATYSLASGYPLAAVALTAVYALPALVGGLALFGIARLLARAA